jgi:hypothetical protein
MGVPLTAHRYDWTRMQRVASSLVDVWHVDGEDEQVAGTELCDGARLRRCAQAAGHDKHVLHDPAW